MPKVEIYTKSWCPYSARALAHLTDKAIAFEEIDVTTDSEREGQMVRRAAGRTSVPQIFIDGHHIGGSDDLIAADESGELDQLLGLAPIFQYTHQPETGESQ